MINIIYQAMIYSQCMKREVNLLKTKTLIVHQEQNCIRGLHEEDKFLKPKQQPIFLFLISKRTLLISF